MVDGDEGRGGGGGGRELLSKTCDKECGERVANRRNFEMLSEIFSGFILILILILIMIFIATLIFVVACN